LVGHGPSRSIAHRASHLFGRKEGDTAALSQVIPWFSVYPVHDPYTWAWRTHRSGRVPVHPVHLGRATGAGGVREFGQRFTSERPRVYMGADVRDERKRGVTCGFTVRAMGGRVRAKPRKSRVTSRYGWAGRAPMSGARTWTLAGEWPGDGCFPYTVCGGQPGFLESARRWPVCGFAISVQVRGRSRTSRTSRRGIAYM